MGKAYSLCFLCISIWSLNYIARQILLTVYPPFFLSAFSLTVVSVLFILVAFWRKAFVKVTGRQLWLLLVTAFIGLIANQIFLYTGLKRTTATNASLIFTLAPLMTAGLAALFLKEKITWRMMIGSVIALIGLFGALGVTGVRVSAGDLYIVGAVFTFACNMILVRLLSATMTPFMITAYSFLLSAIVFDPFVLGMVRVDWSHSLRMWGFAFISVIVAQGLASVLWNKGMETIGAARSAIMLNLQPIMTMLLDFTVFDHPIRVQQVFGAALVLIGVFIATSQKEQLNNEHFAKSH
ncbi:DMT family transporter [Paenibacillus caui]|uniref:DMT family transporter n=1 Tax=Paenibacillus caui TaxID=2873927 RepID=UPI001CA87FB4|nr:DMT family transporter [Paenibacillus caui]